MNWMTPKKIILRVSERKKSKTKRTTRYFFDVNDIKEKSDDEDDIDNEFGDPTYKPGSDMLDFDFDVMKHWIVTMRA